MRNIRALTDNISYSELRFIYNLLPYLTNMADRKEKTFEINIAELCRRYKHTGSTGNKALKALAISEVITYKAKQMSGTKITIISPTGVYKIKDYFRESGVCV